MKHPADWQKRQKGRDPEHSCIVQAPAGSGKTELLTQRMLALLARVANPEEVIAITFTRKAAAEMNHRLFQRLRDAVGHDDTQNLQDHEQVSRGLALEVLENDAQRGWNLLEQPGRLRIRTIDSLCGELARQLPVLSGLGGGQQITVEADLLYRKAATRTMSIVESPDDELRVDIIRVLDRYDNQYDRLVDLLTSMLASRDQWLPHLLAARSANGFDRPGLEQSLRLLIEVQLKEARDNLPESLLRELPRFFDYALSNEPVNATGLKALLDSCGGRDCDFLDLPSTAGSLAHWSTMIDNLLTKDGKKWRAGAGASMGFPPPSKASGADKVRLKTWKDEFKDLLDEHRGNDPLRESLNMVRALPDPDYEDEAWESLESLMRLMLRATTEWKLVMAETGEVDFGEIAQRAIEALGHEDAPSDLALRMDYRIQHLLVDEFQDTSHSQIRLLEKLTGGWSDGDGRSLFLVGDPMQSIYRFRKAEVSLFIDAWRGRLFRHIRLQPLQLSVNFRSTRPIVEWVNRIFPVVMPAKDNPVMGAVTYSGSTTRPGVRGHGRITTDILPDRDDPEEARRVIEVIRQCEPDESVAILVRSRNHASAILKHLDKLKQDQPEFRYQAINFFPLGETMLIRDLVSLTLALIQPADRLAWLSLLRAPFVGIALPDLETLVEYSPSGIILEAIAGDFGDDPGGVQNSLSMEARQRMQRIGPVLLKAVAASGCQPIRTQVECAWLELGGPACLENKSELEDAATFFDLLGALEADGLHIDRDTLDTRMEKLFAEPDASASARLQVLTIYAAKGLEFDTVILPGLNRAPAGGRNKLLHWFELPGENQMVLSPMRSTAEKEKQKNSGDLIQFISAIEKQRQRLEDGRLLYVAATRAIHSLHLFAAIRPNAKDEIEANRNSLLGGLWPAVKDRQAPLIRQAAEELRVLDLSIDQHESGMDNPPEFHRKLAPDWVIPAPPESVVQSQPVLSEARDYIEFSWAGEEARLTGNLVHRLLQLIAEQGIESWNAYGGIDSCKNWCYQQLLKDGVGRQGAAEILERVQQAVSNCLASERGRWILHNHEDARCELAITAVLDDRARNLVLDRSFVDKDVRWIIDYKTSSHSGGDIDGFLENESKRYRGQMQRYKKAVAITETLPIETALYYPLLDRFCVLDLE